MDINHIRNNIVGIETQVPCLDGISRRYVYLDNAASTPAFKSVLRCLEDFMPFYSGVHRGTGFKSLLSTELFDVAHEVAGRFVGADLNKNSVIFVKNTTEAINKLASRMNLTKEDIIVVTEMEHHSNDLPWRKYAKVLHLRTDSLGYLDLNHLEEILTKFDSRIKMVAVSGASNITGYINPVYEIASMVHNVGAKICVDAAQLVPHRKFDILADDDDRHIDFTAFSAHKIYAPFGTGVLIGPKTFFEKGEPDMVGGGVVEIVTLDDAYWTYLPFKEEAGSPNVVGGITLARAIYQLEEFKLDEIANHEKSLLQYAYKKLKQIPEVELYGDVENLNSKVGVIPFNIRGVHHALTASILSFEGGIGVRNGCFCAHPYVKHLLKITKSEEEKITSEIKVGNKSNLPGMVRASFGCYNNEEDVDRMIEMIENIVNKNYKGDYVLNPQTGSYKAKNFNIELEKYFPLHRIGSLKRNINYPETS